MTPIPGGGYTVTLTKATLDDAYSVFKLNTTVSGGTTIYADGAEPAGSSGLRPQLRVPSAAVAGDAPNSTASKGLFTCDNPEAAQTVAVSFDLRDFSWEVSIDASKPYARVVANSSPKLTVSLSSSVAQTCKLNTDAFTWKIPFTLFAVPLTLVVHPSLEVTGSGAVTAEATLNPKLSTGVVIEGGTSRPIGSLTASASAKLDGKVSVDAFLGVTAGVTLPGEGEGTAGLTLTAGPRAQVAFNDRGCTTLSAGVRVSAEVFVSVFVNKWAATLAVYAPDRGGVYDSCSGQTVSTCAYPQLQLDGSSGAGIAPPMTVGVYYDAVWRFKALDGCGPWTFSLFVGQFASAPAAFKLSDEPVFENGQFVGRHVFGLPQKGGQAGGRGQVGLGYVRPDNGKSAQTSVCWRVKATPDESDFPCPPLDN